MIGRLLRGVHAGEKQLIWNSKALAAAPDTLSLTSAAFEDGGRMPLRCVSPALGGGDASPGLTWAGVPPNTDELLIVAQDPDAPLPRPVVHMIVTGIPGDWRSLPERIASLPAAAPLRLGRISFGRIGYMGPKPPKGHGKHRYIFQIVAVERALNLPEHASLKAVLQALGGSRALARGRLTGLYDAADA